MNEQTRYPSVEKPWTKYYTEEAIGSKLRECSIFEYIEENNRSGLDVPALRFFGRDTTYGELFAEIKKAADAFYSYGIREGDVVAVCLPAIPESAYAVYALNYIGAIPNMLDPRYNEKLLGYCMDDAPAKLLVTLDMSYEKFLRSGSQNIPEKIVMVSAVNAAPFHIRLLAPLKGVKKLKPLRQGDVMWNDFVASGTEPAVQAKRDPEDCAVILHTGGTTGKPKGVMLSSNAINSIAHQCSWLAKEHAVYGPGASVLQIIPPFASYGLCVSMHMAFGLGVIVDMVPKFDPSKFGQLVYKHRSTCVIGVPSFFENMAADPELGSADLSFLKFAISGGDSMTLEQEERLNRFLEEHGSPAQISMGYGMTEVGSVATVCLNDIKQTGCIGAPLIHTMVKTVKPGTTEECGYGESGEICIHGPGMMIGYWNDKELTDKTKRLHDDGLVWVHTGDQGHISEDGFLFFEGRIKRMIVRFDGFKIYPEPIEEVITAHPAVHQCAVVRADDEKLGAIAKAYIVLNDPSADGEAVWNEIVKICGEEMAERAVPQGHEFVTELPLTSIGKVDYRKLEKR